MQPGVRLSRSLGRSLHGDDGGQSSSPSILCYTGKASIQDKTCRRTKLLKEKERKQNCAYIQDMYT